MNALQTKCDCCHADIYFEPEQWTTRCGFCYKKQVRPQSQGETLRDLERANELWADCRFDEAAAQYQAVLARNPDEYEARWKLLLCKYGVQYVTEERSGAQYIICHIARHSSLRNEPEYRHACDLAPEAIRQKYESDADYIDGAQAEILRLKEQEDRPWEIFICFKEKDDFTGRRTDASLYAESIYQRLTDLGYSVFYSNVTLADKAGEDYEAAIHRAIETAKVMLVVGTRREHYEATWVQSEWSRFLKRRAESDPDKVLIPLFRQDILTLPQAFTNLHLQGFDLATDYMSKIETRLDKLLRKSERDSLRLRQLQEQKRQADEANRQLQEELARMRAELERAQQEAGRQSMPAPQPDAVPTPSPASLQMYDVICDECGKATQVPFVPRLDRPVYCESCANAMKEYSTEDVPSLGFSPFNHKDRHEKTRKSRQKAVDITDPKAQYDQGLNYDLGIGVSKDAAKAAKWYRKAAEQGYAKAQCKLGVMYEYGLGVPRDKAEAVRWYRKAAEQGDADAQCSLASMYQFGFGIPKDQAEAIKWYRKAAAQGDKDAQARLRALEKHL